MLTVVDLFGRLHPALVHFPVGILFIAAAFTVVGRSALQGAVPALLFWGMLSAVFSCISGWLLASGGDYAGGLVNLHRWMGIGTAVSSGILYLLYRRQIFAKAAAILVLVLVTVTGHMGGSLTHGETYFQEALTSNSGVKGPVVVKLESPDTAVLYNDLVQPILEARCYGCHGANKQKGKLRLDALNYLLKGGEEGVALQPGKPEESGLLTRIKLPLESKDHMPPKEKAQLTADEMAILHWWVETGGSDTARIGHLKKSAEIAKVMARLAAGETGETAAIEQLPAPEPPAPDTAAMNALQRAGATVIPLARGSHWLSVSFVGAFSKDEATLALLKPLAKQVLTLRLDRYEVASKALDHILACRSVRKLELPHCGIGDTDLPKIAMLKELRFLNLTGNPVTLAGVQQLSSLQQLQQVYLYQTRLSGTEMQQLQQKWEKVKVDSGGYRLPLLPGDTSQVKMN